MRLTADSVLAAAWLTGILFTFNMLEDDSRLLGMLVALCWIAPYAAVRLARRLKPSFFIKTVDRPAIAFAVFLAACLPGSVYSSDSSLALGYLAATAAGGATCSLVGLLLGPQLKRAFTLYAAIGTAGILWIFANYYTGGRFAVFRNANSVGLILLGPFAFSFLIKRRSLRVLLALTALAMIALTESRSALLGSVACAAVMALRAWRSWTQLKRIAALAVLATAGVLVIANASQAYTTVSVLMKLDDPWRGTMRPDGTIQSRIRVWGETVQVWLDHPWVGVGYRTHEAHVISESSSHNGYLAILAETGVLGSAALLLFLTTSVRRLRRQALDGSDLAWVGLALLAGYAVVALFERYMINLGNPTSVAALIFLLKPHLENQTTLGLRRPRESRHLRFEARCYHASTANCPLPLRGNDTP